MMAGHGDHGPLSADEALARLMEGNARFLRGETRYSHTPREILADLAKGQRPFATILGCSDSRVPPELLFDAGFGDLFIIRVAGNVISPEVVGSMQYSAMHLQTQLFMVLGHEGCGAVQAALAAKFHGARERSRIELLLQDLLPGLERIDPGLPPRQQLAARSRGQRPLVHAPDSRVARRPRAHGRRAPEAGGGGIRDRHGTSATACLICLGRISIACAS